MISRTLPYIPFVVASRCASDRGVHTSSKRRFAQRFYRKKSESPVLIVVISFHHLSSFVLTFSNDHSSLKHGHTETFVSHITFALRAVGIASTPLKRTFLSHGIATSYSTHKHGCGYSYIPVLRGRFFELLPIVCGNEGDLTIAYN
jgi:hypothetical protein